MTSARKIIDKTEKRLKEKKKNRELLLDQLALIDAEIDLIDELIESLDKKAFKIFEEEINPKVLLVKNAYDARINSNCRSKYRWEKINENEFDLFDRYKVVENKDVESSIPYFGLKFFQKPMDREYGTKIKAEFVGSVESGNDVIAVTDRKGIPDKIEIGNTITDNLDSPEVFSIGNLPEVVGFGTTNSVGIITTLIGGIEENSNVFHHFGLGDISSVSTGMVLVLPEILPDRTEILSIGTGIWPIQYYDENGDLVSSNFSTTTLVLNKNSLNGTQESEFSVGIITSYPGIFLNTTSSSTKQGIKFKVLRIKDNVDEDFDYTSNPNSPLKIGVINKDKFGIGNSCVIDSSGQPSITETWSPDSTYINPVLTEEECSLQVVERKGVIIKDITEDSRWDKNLEDGEGACVINPEPKVGAGAEKYFIGNDEWPIFYTTSGGIQPTENYASPGQTITATSTNSSTIGYVSTPPDGFPNNCDDLDKDIEDAEKEYEKAIEKYESKAKKFIKKSSILRKEREKLQLYAWSILQSSAKILEEIDEYKTLLKELDDVDDD